MKHKIFTLLFALMACGSSYATKTLIGGIYYDVDFWSDNACVTYGNCTSNADIRSEVTLKYNNKTRTYSVTIISRSAFRGCKELVSVSFPYTLRTIEELAFDNCTGLTSVTIPNSVTSIESDAFGNVANIVYDGSATGSPWGARCVNGYVEGYFVYTDDTKTTLAACSSAATGDIVIPNSVTSIGKYAFCDCSNVTSVTIPESVTSIGEYAFVGCSSLTSLTIPESVTSIGSGAFRNINNILYTGTATGSPWGAKYRNAYVEGLFVYKDDTKTTLIGCAPEISGEVVIPNSVTRIGSSTFYGCSEITSITIPESVTSIGLSAFSGCTGLTSVNIPSSVTTIDYYTFDNCSSLSSISIPKSITSIGSNAFHGCSGLTKVIIEDMAAWCNIAFDNEYSNPLSYAHHLYLNETEVTNLVIPESVTRIGNYAFYGCEGLSSATIPESVTEIGKYAFVGCYGLTAPVYNSHVFAFMPASYSGEYTIPEGIESIVGGAFLGCEGLTSITIPESVTSIGYNAFSECYNLSSVKLYSNTIVSRTSWEGSMRSYFGSQVTEYILGENITSIGGNAFNGCSSLTSITIPESVTSIGGWAFSGCEGLTAPLYNSHVFAFMPTSYSGAYTIPDGIESIAGGAFGYCSGLTSVTIPNSVTSIGSYAFEYCSGLTEPVYNAHVFAYMPTSYSGEYTIPDGIESIAGGAFGYCSGLTSVTIPNSVTSIGVSAFSGCSGIHSLTIPSSVTSIGDNAFGDIINVAYSGTATGSPWGARCVNGAIDGYLVYSDATKTNLVACFPEVTGAITIPRSVTTIDYFAFNGCYNLDKVIIEDLTAWCNIAFGDASSNPLSYAHHLYLNEAEITDLVIPESITKIGEYAFYGCQGLTSVTIPNSVTEIGQYAFAGCNNLSGLTLGNSVASIGNSAFDGCKFSSVTIPNSVTTIGFGAFEHCSNLTSVTIGKGIIDIGGYAFNKCNLPTITISATTPPQTHEASFGWSPSQITAFVPPLSFNAYKEAEGWNKLNIQVANKVLSSPTGCLLFFEQDAEIASIGIEGEDPTDGSMLEITGLEPESEYTKSVILTSNKKETATFTITFMTTTLELATLPSKPVSANTAILLAQTNMADIETSCGFEWKRTNAPDDMAGTLVYAPLANGMMAGRLKGLLDNVYYKYRAFYKSAEDNMYYGDWQYIFTGDGTVEFEPMVYTYAPIAITEDEATIKGCVVAGAEEFSEQGFEYWAESHLPKAGILHRLKAASGEHHMVPATGTTMSVTLTELEPGTVYKYRTYAKIGNQVFYGAEMSFTTKGEYDDTEDVENISAASLPSRKILRNGRILILRGNRTYTLTGQLVSTNPE